jgi:ethanolamine permease
MNIGADPATGKAIELPEGNGPFLPFGIYGILASMPFAVWLFLAIEQLPLAAEESVDPQRDMPKGIMRGMFTLIVLGFLVLVFIPAIPIARTIADASGATSVVHGAFALSTSAEPILDGFRAIFGTNAAGALALAGVIGLVASFHAITFASGRQIYSLSRAGYFPHFLSLTHGTHKTPNVALIAGAALGLAVMLVVWFTLGGQRAGSFIGGVLLNMAVFGAMLSYIAQALSFILLRRNLPNIERPFRSPLGIPGAAVTIVIALVTLYYQVQDPNFFKGVIWVIVWLVVGIIYFALVGRNRLILSPEEEFALRHRKSAS